MKEQIWTGGSSGTTNWHFGDTLNLTNPRISTAAVYAGTELILNNMNKVNNQLVAIFKIERNDKNEITSAKFIKEMWIETKGRWTSADRLKMKHVLASNPGVDIRMVFQSPQQKISKGSKTTYEAYALKLGIKHVAKKDIPADWHLELIRKEIKYREHERSSKV